MLTTVKTAKTFLDMRDMQGLICCRTKATLDDDELMVRLRVVDLVKLVPQTLLNKIHLTAF